MSTKKPSLWRVLSETSRIISAHSLHFLAPSALFLFPISLCTTLYPLLFQPTSLHSHYRRFLSSATTPDSEIPAAVKSQFLIQLLYYAFVLIFNLFAVSSITRTTINGFHDRPVKFASSLKSILVSFFPLLATKLAYMIISWLILFAFGILLVLPYIALVLLDFNVDFTSIYFMVYTFLMAALLFGLFIYMGVEWCLMNPIVVSESQWGFAPLKRSSHLVKGMRRVVLLMIVVLAIPSITLSIWYANLMANYAGNVDEGRTCWVVVQMILFAGFSTILLLYNLVADTVLFNYCKELHGEPTSFEIDEKSGAVYVQLPLDVA